MLGPFSLADHQYVSVEISLKRKSFESQKHQDKKILSDHLTS